MDKMDKDLTIYDEKTGETVNKETGEIIPKAKKSLIENMAEQYNIDHETFYNTVVSTMVTPTDGDDKGSKQFDLTKEELARFLMVADKYKLNPFIREIYAFKAKKNGAIVPIVPIDGWITLAQRRKEYDGYEITFAEKIVNDLERQKVPCPEWCEVTVYRKDHAHHPAIRIYLDESYVPPRGQYKNDGPWQTHTKRMLMWKAIIQGIRATLGISGVYDEDEGHRVIEGIDADINTPPAPPVTLKSLQGKEGSGSGLPPAGNGIDSVSPSSAESPASQPSLPTLTFKELEEKIMKIDNLPHLKNFWKKYKPDILNLKEGEGIALFNLKNQIKDMAEKVLELKKEEEAKVTPEKKLDEAFGGREPGEDG